MFLSLFTEYEKFCFYQISVKIRIKDYPYFFGKSLKSVSSVCWLDTIGNVRYAALQPLRVRVI